MTEEVICDAPSLRESPPALTEADLRNMHHALGSPEGRWVKAYRNYYATDAHSFDGRRFMSTGLWTKARTLPGGLSYFHVTPEGVEEVFAWLDRKNAERGLRPYLVTSTWVRDHIERRVLAKSPSAARYAYFSEISDCWPDGFADWLKRMQPRVRLVTSRKDGASPQDSKASSK